jgi:hypothetical protein
MNMVKRFSALKDTYGNIECVLASDYDQLAADLNTKTAIMAGQQLYIARLEAQLDSLNRNVGKLLLLADLQKDIEELQ